MFVWNPLLFIMLPKTLIELQNGQLLAYFYATCCLNLQLVCVLDWAPTSCSSGELREIFCMRAAQTTIFIIFKISPAYASWRVTLLLVLFCHVQNSLSCSLHCCNYIFALVMCTYRNISGWSDINTKICEQCGMTITKWLWIGIRMCWCSRASTRGGKTTCTWLSTYNQQVETGHAGIRCRSQKKWNKTLR